MTFSEYLFTELETKDRLIHDLKHELQVILKTDEELLSEASHQIENLKQQCTNLVSALSTTFNHLEKFYRGEELEKLADDLGIKPLKAATTLG